MGALPGWVKANPGRAGGKGVRGGLGAEVIVVGTPYPEMSNLGFLFAFSPLVWSLLFPTTKHLVV